MSTFYAQPYNLDADGFFFADMTSYRQGITGRTDHYGMPVEEYELQFIDGTGLNAAFAGAVSVNQANIASYFQAEDAWNDDQKIRVIIAMQELGHFFHLGQDLPNDLDLDLYEIGSLRELAEQFVEDGLFGTIPDRLAHYIDYDAIARDLAFDYGQVTIAGRRFIYRST